MRYFIIYVLLVAPLWCLAQLEEEPLLLHGDTVFSESVGEEVFAIPDVAAAFVGGMSGIRKYFQATLQYPDQKLKGRTSLAATVWVQAILTESGKVSSVVVKEGFTHAYDEEALRAVRVMPKWTPAQRAGKPIRSKVDIPVVFETASEVSRLSDTE